jgi:hypothetical protein
MVEEFKGEDSHISISMPYGETCCAFFPFQVYSTDEGGEIVRFSWEGVNKLTEAIETHSEINNHLPDSIDSMIKSQNLQSNAEAEIHYSLREVINMAYSLLNIRMEHLTRSSIIKQETIAMSDGSTLLYNIDITVQTDHEHSIAYQKIKNLNNVSLIEPMEQSLVHLFCDSPDGEDVDTEDDDSIDDEEETGWQE